MCALIGLVLSFGVQPRMARAQSGALFLLTPFGGRAVGRGEAVAADSSLGTEGIWWNPASMARMKEREGGFSYSSSLAGTAFMLSAAVPSRVLGTFAAGAYLLDTDVGQATDSAGNPVGDITIRNYLLAASYASPVGNRLSGGLTLKYIRFQQGCTGCNTLPTFAAGTSALDVGAQYRLPDVTATTVGVTLRNIGQPLQIKDAKQADPLPRLLQLGVRTRLPFKALREAGASLDVSVDVLRTAQVGASSEAIGAVLGYREQLFLSAGYKHLPDGLSAPTIGVSVQRGAFGFDLARRFEKLASEGGEPSPTYFSLHFKF